METNARAAERGFLRRIRRLSRWQVAFLLPSAGLVVAVLLHVAQWVTSWISTAVARAQGAGDACSDLADTLGVDPDAIEIEDRAPSGFVCQAPTYDGGHAIIEHSGATSALFMLALAFAALSVAVLLGVLIAFMVTRLLGLYRSPFAEPRRDRWPLRLIGIGVFMLPVMMLGQYFQWYSKSDGFGICPFTVGGNDVLGFSVTADYLPPSLTCSGDTVTGQEFSVTQYGFPFYGFLAGVVVAAVGLGLLVVARMRRTRVEADQQRLRTARD
ncbi:hypothetical protein GCM10010974_19960 [Brevibacterium sediminis]|uniref:Uncharacterized protein n=1 Tax=Brevibacterium sediminis TaxID=1857024 RepID=A0ABQ1ME67_9MICO|nr:hypothetical protein [Brevibacterium sediminis]GGC37546.1 hypothetical protein GCM10010974_19960 [Brevibacterium sediminis]